MAYKTLGRLGKQFLAPHEYNNLRNTFLGLMTSTWLNDRSMTQQISLVVTCTVGDLPQTWLGMHQMDAVDMRLFVARKYSMVKQEAANPAATKPQLNNHSTCGAHNNQTTWIWRTKYPKESQICKRRLLLLPKTMSFSLIVAKGVNRPKPRPRVVASAEMMPKSPKSAFHLPSISCLRCRACGKRRVGWEE